MVGTKVPFLDFRERRVCFTDEGDGPPLLLIAGLGGRQSFWAALKPRLTPGFRVLTFDHPGCGESEAPRADLSVADLAALVVVLFDRREIDSALVVGHSMGGAIAQVLALDHASRVSSLVLSSTWAKSDPYFERAFAQRRELLQGLGKEAYARAQCLAVLPPAFVAESPEEAADFERAAVAGAAPDRIVLARIAALLAFDRAADLGRIDCPTLAFACRDDLVVPPHMSRDLATRIPGAIVSELSTGGHFAPLIVADAYGEALQPFLTEQAQRFFGTRL